MQQLILHKKLYQVSRIDETEYSQEAYERFETLKTFKRLRNEGCSITTACIALKTPMSTLYRWRRQHQLYGLVGLEPASKRPGTVRKPTWQAHVAQKVLALRKENPLFGKAKIHHLLKRDHRIETSISTVGRILRSLTKSGKVLPASFYYKKKPVRPRVFDNHAQRWKYGMKAKEPGELFQIDHMSVSRVAGLSLKHFQGTCPVTKMVAEQVYSQANSHIARQFLEHCLSQLPFKLKSVQVDGGSEVITPSLSEGLDGC